MMWVAAPNHEKDKVTFAYSMFIEQEILLLNLIVDPYCKKWQLHHDSITYWQRNDRCNLMVKILLI